MSRDLADRFDLLRLDAAFYDDPYPTYRALREHAPVKRLPNGSVFLTRYDDLVAVYKDTQRFSSDKREEFAPKYGGGNDPSPLFTHHTTSLVFNDPPLHTRVRRLIAGALTPTHIAAMEPALIARVDQLLDAMHARAARGETVDLIDDFASAIPIEIIGNLLAIPQVERAPLRDWSLAILGALEPVLTPQQRALGNRAVEEFVAYLETLIAHRSTYPGDPEVDVLSRLIAGVGDGDAHVRLTPAELMHNCVFLLNAGHETTTNLIGNGLSALTAWPDQRARLIADPSLINTAVGSSCASKVRTSSATASRPRRWRSAVRCSRRGHRCTCASAPRTATPRDPGSRSSRRRAGAESASRVRLRAAPNGVGLALARLEGRVAVSRFLARFPGYRICRTPERGGRARFRGFLHVPATLC